MSSGQLILMTVTWGSILIRNNVHVCFFVYGHKWSPFQEYGLDWNDLGNIFLI